MKPYAIYRIKKENVNLAMEYLGISLFDKEDEQLEGITFDCNEMDLEIKNKGNFATIKIVSSNDINEVAAISPFELEGIETYDMKGKSFRGEPFEWGIDYAKANKKS